MHIDRHLRFHWFLPGPLLLLFHGDADTTVPVETSDALAKSRTDIVRYHRVHGATHIRSWNMNPAAYETVVHNFLHPRK